MFNLRLPIWRWSGRRRSRASWCVAFLDRPALNVHREQGRLFCQVYTTSSWIEKRYQARVTRTCQNKKDADCIWFRSVQGRGNSRDRPTWDLRRLPQRWSRSRDKQTLSNRIRLHRKDILWEEKSDPSIMTWYNCLYVYILSCTWVSVYMYVCVYIVCIIVCVYVYSCVYDRIWSYMIVCVHVCAII